LTTGNPGKLTLLGSIPGDFRLETRLHHRFASLRIRGEWFRASRELIEAVKQFLAAPDGKIGLSDRNVWRECQRRQRSRFGLNDVDVRRIDTGELLTIRFTTWDKAQQLILVMHDGSRIRADQCELEGDWPLHPNQRRRMRRA
jgi:hypothetical protein